MEENRIDEMLNEMLPEEMEHETEVPSETDVEQPVEAENAETETVEPAEAAEAEATEESAEEEKEAVAETDIQPPPAAKPKKKKKKHLRLWVRILLATIAAIIAFALFMYIMGGAILQESYKLSPPSSEEVAATLKSASIYKWLVASYGVH